MPIDVIMPKVDMVMDEGTIAKWYKAEGDPVRAGEPLFDIETDKAVMEVEAPASGTLVQVSAQSGTTVPVATVIALILEQGESLPQASAPAPAPAANGVAAPAAQSAAPAPVAAAPTDQPRPRATPLARKLAREHGLDLATLLGAGPHGRIRKDDVLQALERAAATPAARNGTATPEPAPAPAPIQKPAPQPLAAPPASDGRLVPLVGVRKIIAQRLAVSATIPQFVLSMDVDMTAANQLRERLPFRPSVTALLARVVAATLPRHPSLNASFRADGIWLHTPVHLGIALDSSGDLLVPVIRDAHARSLREIATALSEIRTKAEAKKLSPAELQGSTFSISNLGMLGVDHFTALVNPPEAAILAVGRTTRRPFEATDGVVFKPIMTLTLSADHRVTDGAAGARFLQDVRAAMEEPLLLL